MKLAPHKKLYDYGFMEMGLLNYYFQKFDKTKQNQHPSNTQWLEIPYKYNAQWLKDFDRIEKEGLVIIHDKFWKTEPWRDPRTRQLYEMKVEEMREYHLKNLGLGHVGKNRSSVDAIGGT